MMAPFAGLERDIIHERTMAAAKAQGRTGGRPAVMDADKLAAARARRESRQDRQGPSASAAPRSTAIWPLRASKARSG
jgi:DNA invertase Pin-like site-specific DNA recombinase